MTVIPDAARLKRKMLGVRLRSARTQVGMNIAEAARHLGIEPATLTNYELGAAEISLPELEAMAHIFAVPASYFWSTDAPLKEPNKNANVAKKIPIRRKIIGVLIKQVREEAGQSQDQLAAALHCSTADLAAYEAGTKAIPFSRLESLAAQLQVPLSRFLENPESASAEPTQPVQTQAEPQTPTPLSHAQQGFQGEQVTVPADLAWLANMPDDIKEFLADPSSTLYLRLSMRLHGLSTETLRALAEGILDITY